MGFLDTIGQRPQSRQNPRPAVAERVTWNDATPVMQNTQTPAQDSPKTKSSENSRIRSEVIWRAGLFVIAAVAVAAWLGIHNFVSVVSPETEASSDTASAADATAEKTTQNPTSVRPHTAVHSTRRSERAIGTGVAKRRAGDSRAASASTLDAAGQTANVPETETAPVAAVTDVIAAAPVAVLPEDDYVYSGEGGVVPPRLMSLGFVPRQLSGFEARTSTIELVISKSGTVERAKIFSVPRNWEDAMLLSRAKTFQFVPAQRNGSPVRYRFVMDVDTSP
jgi:hypothetical protein